MTIAAGSTASAADLLVEHNANGMHKYGTIYNLGFPTGVVMPFAGAAAPAGALLCDGAAVSRTTYAALFAVIGTTYGAGDGSTTFNVPDLKGRFPVGKGAHADVDALGDSDGLADASRTPKMAAHTHAQNMSATNIGVTGVKVGATSGSGADVHIDTSGATTDLAMKTGVASGGGGNVGFVTMNYIIKT